LKKTTNQSQQKTLIEAKEDEYSNILRNWCLKVRSEVLVPTVETQSETTRPPASGIMPPVMKQVISEAEHFGIFYLSDVKRMIECFRSICWSFSAMGVLRRKPSLSEVRHLISEASKFKLPDERALRTLKFMANRASQLQSKIEKALCPEKGESKPMNVSILKELESGTRESPLVVPEEEMLRIVIEDNGTRHCTCGGPRDGKQIFFCDFCNKRFHAACMKREKAFSNELTPFLCPCCREDVNASDRKLILESSVENQKEPHCPSIDFKDDVSPHAPNPMELWPPFGLLQSQTAIQTFGSECLAIPDVTTTNTDIHAQRNEVLSGCSSSSKALTQKRITVSSEVHDREESFKIDKTSTVSVQIKKFSPEAELRNDTSQLDEKSCFSATSKKVSSQDDNPRIESSLPDLIPQPRQSFLQNDAKIMNPKIFHDSGQPITDLSIPPNTSNNMCRSQLETQRENEAKSCCSNEDTTGMPP
jgi:hypothetical protein